MLPNSQRVGLAPKQLILSAIYVLLFSFFNIVSAHKGDIRVKSGQSIQAAINSAACGDRIVVEAGTYAEQLIIDKDRVSLVGRGAILVPPSILVDNKCTGLAGPGTQTGLCVLGTGVALDAWEKEHLKVLSVQRPVDGVTVTGFKVQGFGINIAVYGATNAKICDNQLYDGSFYGLLSAGSKHNRLTKNIVGSSVGLPFIAICNDDMADVEVANNQVSNYSIGLCIQTPGAEVRKNTATNICYGAAVDPGVKGAKVRENSISGTNPKCITDFPYGAIGIFLFGASNTEVKQNTVDGQHQNAMAAGIVVIDSPPYVSSDNVVAKNTFRDNDFDIYVNTTGTGNKVSKNTCTLPVEYCSGQ